MARENAYRHRPTNTDREAANLAKLPEFCYTNVLTERVVCIIKRGESGYYRTDWDMCRLPEDRKAQIATMNERLGVSAAQVLAMEIGSMCGWEVPGADVDQHKTEIK